MTGPVMFLEERQLGRSPEGLGGHCPLQAEITGRGRGRGHAFPEQQGPGIRLLGSTWLIPAGSGRLTITREGAVG